MESKGKKATLTFERVKGALRAVDAGEVTGFAVAGEDKKWVWAEAKIKGGNLVELWSDAVENPVAVRYAWADNPVCNMYDAAGLPLTPFRTDDWPGVTIDSK